MFHALATCYSRYNSTIAAVTVDFKNIIQLRPQNQGIKYLSSFELVTSEIILLIERWAYLKSNIAFNVILKDTETSNIF